MTDLHHEPGRSLRDHLVSLRARRELAKAANRRPRSKRLGSKARSLVYAKTGGKCHICGGDLGERWQADHVLAHSAGGGHSEANYLPAHATCNNYRWDYLAEEFELILKLGVWSRTQIEKGTKAGRQIEALFQQAEERRIARRKRT